eukprot:184454_1
MYNQDIHTSPDLDSIFNDQFGRLQDKEEEVHCKLRASKHTSKHLASYLEKRSEIEAKYMSEITHLCDAFAPKIDESDSICSVWRQLLENDKSQCEERRRYMTNLNKEHQLFTQSYIEHKSAENAMAKQMESNRKVLSHWQRKLDVIMSDMENVQNELKKMDERRRNEHRDRFNDKELKRFKELRIKLAHLESVKVEKNSAQSKSKHNQRTAMAQTMKAFLKQQIHHLNSIKRSLFDLETHQSELFVKCDQMNKKKLALISEINPVKDVLDWVSSIHNIHRTPSVSKHSIHNTHNEESASAISNTHRPRSASVDFITTPQFAYDFLIKDKDLLNSALITEYWSTAFPRYVGATPSLSTLAESPKHHTALYGKDRDIDHDGLLSETAHHIKDFKSLYSIKSGYGVYCPMDQIFPCNLSYKKLNAFCLQKGEWNRLYFEFLSLASGLFGHVSPHVDHLWHVVIPQTLQISKAEVQRLMHCMQPIDNATPMTLNYYVWLISYKTRFEFKNDEEYGAWLRRQLTVIVAAIAWTMSQQYKSQWRLYEEYKSYAQIISYLNHQCVKIVTFVAKYPCNHPSDHKELQSFIQNIDCLMQQLSEYKENKGYKTPSLNKTQSMSGLNASEDDFESQSEIEYLSDDEEESAVHDDLKQDIVSPFKTPSKQHNEHRGYIGRYNIAFPKQISRFILWQLMNIFCTQTRSNPNRNRKSVDLSDAFEIKIEEDDDDYDATQVDESKVMIHSKVLSTTTDDLIDYDDLCLIPGTIEARQSNTVRVIRSDYREFLDSFESAYCDLLGLNPYIVWVLMARLTVDVCLDHIGFDCDAISLLESLMSVPSESAVSTSLSAPSIAAVDETVHHAAEEETKRSTKYHINKKWGKLKRRMSITKATDGTPHQDKKKKKKFRPKKLARRLSLNIHKRSKSSKNEHKQEHDDDETLTAHCESMKQILCSMWLNIYQSMNENNASAAISNADDDDAIVSLRIIDWILGHLQNWLFSYQSYPISITKDYFHLFIAAQSLTSCSIAHAVRSIEYILVAATHIKYDAIYDSIMDIRFKKKMSTTRVEDDRVFNVNEWEMFVEALVNWMDIESNNNQSVFEQYRIHPKIGQFILFTICQRFSTAFKHYVFNTDPFRIRNRSISVPSNDMDKQLEQMTAFMDPRLVRVCAIARQFETNMRLNKKLLTMETDDALYREIGPSSTYIALSQLGQMMESQSNELLEWTKSLLLGEDWIGIDEDQPFAQSVIHLFNALNRFTDHLFAATSKLQIRTILSNHGELYDGEWNVRKLRDSLIGIIGSCVNYYSDYVVSISGKTKDVVPDSTHIMDLNATNLQKSDNFNLKEIYRKSKKSLMNNKTLLTSPQQDTAMNANNSRYLLYEQKAEILCTRFESIGKAIVLCKSLNHKIKTIWFETSDTLSMTPTRSEHHTYEWLNGSVDNLCRSVDHMGNLIAYYTIFVRLRLDIIHNLYSSKPAIASPNGVEDAKHSPNKCNMKGGSGKIAETAISLNLWHKMGSFFEETLSHNTSLDGFDCMIGKTLGVYLLSIRWIVLHSNKNRKFDVGDHRVIQSDMIPLIKFFSTYLSNERIGEIRLLSTIDTIIDLMSKPTQILIDNASNKMNAVSKPFVISKNKYYSCLNTPQTQSISSLDHDVLSIIDSIHNPFVNRNNQLFHPSNYKSVLALLPYLITKQKDLILHILVRRIQRNAQRYVAQELQVIADNQNKNDTNSDSDSFVSF